jgi:hypothetical protein
MRFKFGDKVQVIDTYSENYNKIGKIERVLSKQTFYDYVVRFDDDVNMFVDCQLSEMVFELGDPVLITKDGSIHYGCVGEISRINQTGTYRVTFNYGGEVITRTYYGDNLEPVQEVEKENYYDKGGIRNIEYIQKKLGKDDFRGYCRGNLLKYTARYGVKHDDVVSEATKIKDYACWLLDNEMGVPLRKGENE